MKHWLIASALAAGIVTGPAFADDDDYRGRHPGHGYGHYKHYDKHHWKYRGPEVHHHYYGGPRYYYPPRVYYYEPYYHYPRSGGELELRYRIILK